MATMCDSGAVKLKAGFKLVSQDITTAQYDIMIEYAEGQINLQAGKDFVTDFGGLPTIRSTALADACSSRAGIIAAIYDDTKYSSGQMTNILNVNWSIFADVLRQIKERKGTDFLTDGEQ